MKVLVAQSCLNSLRVHKLWPASQSSVHGILRVRILGWFAIPFSGVSSWLRYWTWVSRIGCRFYIIWTIKSRASPVALVVKNPNVSAGDIKKCGFDPWVGKILWRRKWQPTPVFLPEESRTEEPGGLQSIGSQRVGHNWSNLACTCNPDDLISRFLFTSSKSLVPNKATFTSTRG